MAASDKQLGALHLKVTEVLIEALDGEVIPGYTDDEGNVVQEERKLAPSAAIIAAATKFLKDNDITCDRDKGSALNELEERMAAQRSRRKASVVDFEQARADAKFMTGG